MNKINTNIEEEIFQQAFEALRKNIPGLKIIPLQMEPLVAAYRPDRRLKIVIQGKTLNYYAEIKPTVTKLNKLQMLMYKEKLNYPLLLIAQYINAQMAEQLRNDGIEFIDTAGNMFFKQPPIYVFVKGNKPPEITEQTHTKRVFKPAGLRIIYALLCNPGFEKWTYRKIAAAADVALGTVNWTMKELKELGFLRDMGKQGNKLNHKKDLFDRWVTAYPEQLKPKQMLGHYKGQYGWWQQKKLEPLNAQWGGEVAAEKLTQYLKPEVITIYTTAKHLNQLLLDNRLQRDVTGNVEILERFWKLPDTQEYDDLVHPVLIYADLLATGDQRNIETGKMIYERYIIQLIRED